MASAAKKFYDPWQSWDFLNENNKEGQLAASTKQLPQSPLDWRLICTR
jgi:hypothetical protein